MSNNINKSRLGIFVFHDSDGIVDNYITYMLNDLVANLENLVVVVNGKITQEGRVSLQQFASEIIVRKNEGYDCGAWKDALVEHIGLENLKQYDELVLLNDSFFGPFYSFEKIFEKMNASDIDFWGLTKQGADPDCEDTVAYLHRYFLVYRKNILQSNAFSDFFCNFKNPQTRGDAVKEFDVGLTKCLTEAGFKFDSLINTDDLDAYGVVDHCNIDSYELINRGWPVINKSTLVENYGVRIQMQCLGEDVRLSLDYIREHFQYNMSLIWQNLLRTQNITDIYQSANLNFILSKSHLNKTDIETKQSKVLVVLHIYYVNRLERYDHYITSIPESIDVIITAANKEKAEIIRNRFEPVLGARLKVILTQNRGRDLAALLVAARPYIKDYEYLCFCHDKLSPQLHYAYGNYFEYLLWENTLGNNIYIENVISSFEENKELGLLAIPSPNNTGGIKTNFWTHPKNIEQTKVVLKKIGINSPNISEEKLCLSMGTAFWCRVNALEKLFNYPWKNKDFPKEPLAVDGTFSHGLERSFPFVAQNAGYYTGVAMTEEHASYLYAHWEYRANELANRGNPKRLEFLGYSETVTNAVFDNCVLGFENILSDIDGSFENILNDGKNNIEKILSEFKQNSENEKIEFKEDMETVLRKSESDMEIAITKSKSDMENVIDDQKLKMEELLRLNGYGRSVKNSKMKLRSAMIESYVDISDILYNNNKLSDLGIKNALYILHLNIRIFIKKLFNRNR